MRVAIVTDAWVPQVNGVVRTLTAVRDELLALGHEVLILSPDRFLSVPCPTYPEIRLAFARSAAVGRMLERFAPDAIHLATEGPVCLAARNWCLARRFAFTSAYHTRFPDYVSQRTGADPSWIWRYIRWFHRPAHAVLVSTPSVARELAGHGLPDVRLWGRGIDFSVFGSDGPRDPAIAALPGPILLYVGRIAVEKNIEAFLSLDHPGSKVVIGDGPARASLARRYPRAHFLGARSGHDLAAAYRAGNVLVFPSRTDTFGLVMIEALACGTPVAAYPVDGPLDVLDARVASMADDLGEAVAAALTRDRTVCAAYSARFSWPASTRQFVQALVPLSRPHRMAA